MRIKKMVSDKVIAANRENAKKSTGPREVAGKLAVRDNALTTQAFQYSVARCGHQRDRPAIPGA